MKPEAQALGLHQYMVRVTTLGLCDLEGWLSSTSDKTGCSAAIPNARYPRPGATDGVLSTVQFPRQAPDIRLDSHVHRDGVAPRIFMQSLSIAWCTIHQSVGFGVA